jgi:hypothetical protein
MHALVDPKDPSIKHVFQGVQQDCYMRPFRQGVTADGKQIYIDARDDSKYYLSQGSFETNSLYVVVEHPGEGPCRAGGSYTI